MIRPALVFTAVAAAASASAVQAQSAANDGVSTLLTQFAQDWSGGDSRGLAALFSPDADFINPDGVEAVGHDQIEAFYAAAFQSGYRGSKGEGSLVALRQIAPDLVLIDGTWRIDGAKMADGSPRPSERGVLSAVVRQTPSGWKIVALRESASAAEITPLPR